MDAVTGPGQPSVVSSQAASYNQPATPSDPQSPANPRLDNLIDRGATGNGRPILHGFGCSVAYYRKTGLGWSPLAAEGSANELAVWRIHSPVCLKVVTWVVQATGDNKPELPSSATGDNEVLLDDTYAIEIPGVLVDGTPTNSVAGRYEYILQAPPRIGDQLASGRHPLSITPPALNTLNPYDFVPLLGYVPPVVFGGTAINF